MQEKDMQDLLDVSFGIGRWHFVSVYVSLEVLRGRRDMKEIEREAGERYWKLWELKGGKRG